MPKYDPKSSTPIQVTAREILKTMYNPPPVEEALHTIDTPVPDDLKMQPHWVAKRLAKAMHRGRDVSISLIDDALKMLQTESYIALYAGAPSGYELIEKGRKEAERLEVTRS
jgi:hypothetical protein